MSVEKRVENRVKCLGRGAPVPIERFHDLGPPGAVGTALSHLVKKGGLVNVARGLCARPRPDQFFGTVLPSDVEVARAILRAKGERLATHGAEAARRLGLTTQMPVWYIYET